MSLIIVASTRQSMEETDDLRAYFRVRAVDIHVHRGSDVFVHGMHELEPVPRLLLELQDSLEQGWRT